ncbi:MAG: prolyl-tRNA synthetase [Campylobacterota bacterium]|nr:prolyl-tRNA synthetase [Campylobacterota bacterium]
MKFSKIFLPTLKESPKEAVLKSHIYLLRAGFIAQVAAGVYDLLPLGKKVLDNIKKVVAEELDKAGAQEVSLGFVTPISMWEKSGRYFRYGKELLRFADRHGNGFVLGPTHEEMMVELVKNRVKSYKQLPLNLYQIGLKFRDEARPRFGLMRGREFVMKDGYSFHSSVEDMQREFALMQETYGKIFKRLGLDFRVVDADSGAIGGSGSKEFMVLAESGEDTIVVCQKCSYASNIEAAKRVKKIYPEGEILSKKEVFTPNLKTIEELSEFFKLPKDRFVKAVAKKALYDDKEEIVLFFIRGNDELEETKACNAVKANELVDVEEAELEKAGIVSGFISFLNQNEKIIIDSELKNEKNMICGANKKDYHITGIDVDFDDEVFDDIIAVKEGDSCVCCGASLTHTKGIEVGHIFQLGTKYSEPLEAYFLNEQGKTMPFVMGTYGIGVSRLIAAIIEQHHDEKGCIWTKESTPYMVDVVTANIKDEAQMDLSENIYSNLQKNNISALWDDRNERIGFKLKDYELIGIPYAIIVGKEASFGQVEFVERRTLKNEIMSFDEAISRIKSLA